MGSQRPGTLLKTHSQPSILQLGLEPQNPWTALQLPTKQERSHTIFNSLLFTAHSSLPLRTADISPPMDVAALIRVLALLRHWMSQADSFGHIFRLSPTWKFRISGPLQGGIQCTLMNYLGHSIKTPVREATNEHLLYAKCCSSLRIQLWTK